MSWHRSMSINKAHQYLCPSASNLLKILLYCTPRRVTFTSYLPSIKATLNQSSPGVVNIPPGMGMILVFISDDLFIEDFEYWLLSLRCKKT